MSFNNLEIWFVGLFLWFLCVSDIFSSSLLGLIWFFSYPCSVRSYINSYSSIPEDKISFSNYLIDKMKNYFRRLAHSSFLFFLFLINKKKNILHWTSSRYKYCMKWFIGLGYLSSDLFSPLCTFSSRLFPFGKRFHACTRTDRCLTRM